MEKQFIIYALLCPKCNCPRYIGKSTKGIKRISEHRSISKYDCSRHKVHWVQSLIDEGLMFDWVILTELNSPDQLDEAEQYWIKYFREIGCPLTNITSGGKGTYGWKQSPETVEKRVSKLRGIPLTEETKAKISATLMGHPSPKKGKPLSEKAKKSHAEARKIPPFKDHLGRVYYSIKEASDKLDIPKGNICKVLKGIRKSAGGMEFSYL